MARTLLNTTLVMLIATTAFFVGVQVGGNNRPEADAFTLFSGIAASQPKDVDFTPLWRAWHLLDQKFVPATTTDAVTDEDKLWGAIQGVAGAYDDPYTVFLPPDDSEVFQEDISGSFGGAGMEIGMRDDVLTVIAPLKNTPAQEAGILAGDRIIEIDGKSTKNMTVDEAVKIIRGEVGTEVVLTIAREGERELLDITIVRDTIEIPTMDTRLRDDGIFVIELYNFGATAPSQFRAALREFITSGATKLVIDLRGNPGGFLEAAVEVASWFLPAGKVVVQEHFGEDEERVLHRSKGYDVYKSHWDIAILINEGSASASEIVAGALREHGVATLIGETTFGKGSVQELVNVTDATSLKVTIARWLTPKGVSISEGGLEPDIAVEMNVEDIEAERDPQMDRAVRFLLEGQ